MGQIDSAWIKEVSVVESRSSKFAVGSQLFTIDSTQLASHQGQSLTEVLQFESGIYLKHYSPGNLASTSFRGGSSSQTSLTWNGFNISSPLNGIFDLSLFPVQTFDELKIQPGASSALWGSGAVGGSIHLGHKPQFKEHFNLGAGAQIGSFGFHSENVSLDFGNKRLSHRLIVTEQSAENDFQYVNPFTGQKETQRNNASKTWGILSENFIKINTKNLWSLNWWYQESDREIPPSLFETALNQQTDDISRLTSEWIHQFKKASLKIRGAWFSEQQDYHNLTGDTSFYNNSQALIGEIEYNLKAKRRLNIDLGVNQTSYQGDVQSFRRDPIWQHRQSIFAGISKQFFNKLDVSAMLRQEFLDGNRVPFVYTIGLSWAITKNLIIKGQHSKVYRNPTLNDFYWSPGGNLNLMAEDGNAQELSLVWKTSFTKFQWQTTISAFNRNIQNWIIWQPEAGIWSPNNLLEVWSRGVETNSNIGWKKGKMEIRLRLITNYILSTNEKARNNTDESVGKQLIYTPTYSGTGGLDLKYANFLVRYTHSYTGYTYTASDHSEWLDPYKLGSLYLAYRANWKKANTSLFFRINNIWNEDYQVVRNRLMPSVSYSIGINLNLKFYNQK